MKGMRHAWMGVMALFLVACGGEENAAAAYETDRTVPDVRDVGDRLVIPLGGEPPSLLPLLAGDSGASEVGGHIYQALLTYDADLNLVPQLAARYTISDGGKTITFILRDDVFFSDGVKLTSADVLATFKAITHPETRTPYAGDYLLVSRAEAPDARTFRVHYPEPFVPALSSWAGLTILPAHVLAKTGDFNETSLKDTPLGTGSYTLARWVRGQSITLNRNASSTEVPFIGQLQYKLMPDANTQFMALKKGELDMASLTPLAFSRQTDAPWFKARFNKYSALGNAYTYVGFNLKNPLFEDKRVRQALSYAVDRDGIVAAILFGQGVPMAGIFKPGTWPYNKNLTPYPYDPDKARALLAEAGWADTNGDGVVDKDGAPFTFTLTTNQGNDARLKTAQILQSLFADVGVEMSIKVQEWSALLTNTLQPRTFDAILMGWALGAEPDPYDIWHSSKTAPAEFNMIGYNNPRADALMDKARREFDQTKRQKLLWELQDILHDEQPYLWLYAPNTLMAIHKRIKNVVPAPAGLTYNLPEWWVPQEGHLRDQLAF
ncbi:MAG: peptide-binding protein [Alphaproteobacteria bacterium CG_4_10_14_0_8_um_filter_53_9]|nr:MAG: peptide-binding protein [Alphaproteobacteria bacterium CG_4_10_14_0_8_um_filter_53_9]